jgi:hypothetical protein
VLTNYFPLLSGLDLGIGPEKKEKKKARHSPPLTFGKKK